MCFFHNSYVAGIEEIQFNVSFEKILHKFAFAFVKLICFCAGISTVFTLVFVNHCLVANISLPPALTFNIVLQAQHC